MQLVNPRNMKNVPGKRTDFHECQWIQHLHSMGLLQAAFRPDAEVCAVRSLMRHRNDLVEMASQHVQHMQKALTQMNVQFQHVISDITGLTGLAILDAIVGGERDPAVLAQLRDPTSRPVRRPCVNRWRATGGPNMIIGAETTAIAVSKPTGSRSSDCDQEIEKLVAAFTPQSRSCAKAHAGGSQAEAAEAVPTAASQQTQRKHEDNSPGFRHAHGGLQAIRRGSDADSRVDDAGLHAVQRSGARHVPMAHAAHFVSWLGLCPDNDISGGKVLWRGDRRVKNRAGTLFRLAAHSLHRDPDAHGQLPSPDESQAGSRRRHHRHGAQDRHHLLHHGEQQVEYDASLWAERDTCAKSAWRPSYANRPPNAVTNLCHWSTLPNPLTLNAFDSGSLEVPWRKLCQMSGPTLPRLGS